MKTMYWKGWIGWIGIAVLVALLMAMPVGSRADAKKDKTNSEMRAEAKNTANAKVIATAFHAEWCPLCHHMMPAWNETDKWLQKNQKPVGTVQFIFTDKKTIAASKELAAKENLAGIFDRHKGETGFIFLLNANNHKLISKIEYTDSAKQMKAKIQRAIIAVKQSEKK